ncbi:hypothetical protein LCGC14_2894940 [marine sediment metagenome]|uniref:Uncharacterized protein n=1 Tax=marine sediment metagenome TaxID=412755 RepID=A0A0F9AM92_9ZZZZ
MANLKVLRGTKEQLTPTQCALLQKGMGNKVFTFPAANFTRTNTLLKGWVTHGMCKDCAKKEMEKAICLNREKDLKKYGGIKLQALSRLVRAILRTGGWLVRFMQRIIPPTWTP